jgi:hypothetical protein
MPAEGDVLRSQVALEFIDSKQVMVGAARFEPATSTM